MAGSIPASASAERAPAAAGEILGPALPGRWMRVPGALRRPAGLIGGALMAVVVAVAILADVLAPHDPLAAVGPALAPPAAAHPMGTDDLGRDVLSGVIHGARTSLVIAAGVGVLVLLLGLMVGATAGYRGGVVDHILTRVTELFQTLPRFFLAIVVIALFGAGTDRLILVLGLTSWCIVARVVRAELLSLRELEFIDAAEALGAGGWRIVRRHLLPNALPAAIVYLALLLGQVILLEASLGFLGLGDPNVVSWGALAGQAQRFLRVAWWLSFFPGMAIVVTVLGLNLCAEALNERLARR